MNLTVVGNLTIDEIQRKKTVSVVPGGPAFYVSAAASFLGSQVQLVSNVGTDYPSNVLEWFHVRGVNLEKIEHHKGQTTRFRLSYRKGLRNLRILHKGKKLVQSTTTKRSDATHVGTVFQEIGVEDLSILGRKTRFLSIDVQGLLRTETSRSRIMVSHKIGLEQLIGCNLVKASEDEARVLTRERDSVDAAKTMQQASGGFSLLTRGQRGALLGVPHGVVYDVPSFPEKDVVDPTGAGDTMVGGWIHTYLATRDPLWAACVGSGFASLIIREMGLRKFHVSRTELLRRSAWIYRRCRTPL